MPYLVKQVDPAAAGPMLTALWRENLTIDHRAEEKLRWCYLETPAGPGTAFVLEHESIESPAVPVGCVGLAHLRLFVAGQPVKALQMIDLAVTRRHRTLFPSRKLQSAARAHAREAADVTYGFPNDLASEIFNSLGYRRIGLSRRYARPLRFGALLRTRLPAALAARAAGLIEATDGAWQAVRRRTAHRRGDISFGEQAGPEHEALWRHARRRYRILGDRSAAALAWHLRRVPGSPLELVTFRDRRTEDVLAWAVTETDGQTVHVRDLFAGDRDDMTALLDLLLPALRARDVASISFCYLGASWLPSLLLSRGFRVRPDARGAVVDPGTRTRLPEELMAEPEAWYLTDYDEPG